MMANYRVDISEPAEKDLRDIVRYISVQLSAPMTALRMMDIVEEAIMGGLAVMPQKCPLVTDERLAMMGYRKLFVKNYIVFFTINEKSKVVDVERILYARRDWHHII
ncbi:MAG: type II toxin-antitoxin system RelE/ParE family toxin [Syntrophomonas sp.]